MAKKTSPKVSVWPLTVIEVMTIIGFTGSVCIALLTPSQEAKAVLFGVGIFLGIAEYGLRKRRQFGRWMIIVGYALSVLTSIFGFQSMKLSDIIRMLIEAASVYYLLRKDVEKIFC